MSIRNDENAVSGWIGGFAQSSPWFAYPDPNLYALPMLDNMDNIGLLRRQQAIKWPEFSWETILGNADSRCFVKFAPYISRIGYTDKGRVYSIICPQQGIFIPVIDCMMNVEVTVTGQRGWVNETSRELACDMSVEGVIWFSPVSHDNHHIKKIATLFDALGFPAPITKANAIKINTNKYNCPDNPIFPLRTGETKLFTSPPFARHANDAWSVSNIEVQIGGIQPSGHKDVDLLNQLILDLFNLASGNMLAKTNVLTWNIWVTAPEPVDTQEWKTHAERWRTSIDENHGSPDGNHTQPRYYDGSNFEPFEEIKQEIELILVKLTEFSGK